MLQQIQKYYEDGPLSGSVSSVIGLEIRQACTLKEVHVSVGANVSGANAVFALKKNGVAISGAGVTINVGSDENEATGLSEALAEDDNLDLALSSGSIVKPVILTLTVEIETPVSQSEVYDAVKAILQAGDNTTITPDDENETLTIEGEAGGGGSWDGGQPANTNLANAFFEDDFDRATANESNDPLFWDVTSNGGFCGVSASDANHPGIYTIATNNSSGTPSILALTNEGVFTVIRIDGNFEINAVVKFNGAFDSNALFQVWLADASSSNPNNRLGFEKGFSDTAIYAVSKNSGGTTRTTTGVGAISTWYRLRIRRIDASTIGFTVNNGTEITHTTNIPTGTGLTFVIRVDTNNSTPKSMDIDYFSKSHSGLVRY